MKNLFVSLVAVVFASAFTGCAGAGDNTHVTTWTYPTMTSVKSGYKASWDVNETVRTACGTDLVVHSSKGDVKVEQETPVVYTSYGAVFAPAPSVPAAVSAPVATVTTTPVVVSSSYQTSPVSPVQNTYVGGGYANSYVSSPVGGYVSTPVAGYVSTPVNGYVTSPIGGTVTTVGPVHHGNGYSYQTLVTRGH